MTVATHQMTHAGTLAGLVPADATGDALRVPGRPAITYKALRTAVHEIASGLAALGIRPGDRVGLLSATRPEWVLCDLGALMAATVVVPVYPTNSPEECEHVLGHSGCRLVFVEDAEQAAKLARVRGGLPELRNVVVLDGEVEGAITLDELRRTGKARRTVDGVAADPEDRRRSSTRPGPPACPRGAC
jgi:long-chain acyl-CoA synthetase